MDSNENSKRDYKRNEKFNRSSTGEVSFCPNKDACVGSWTGRDEERREVYDMSIGV